MSVCEPRRPLDTVDAVIEAIGADRLCELVGQNRKCLTRPRRLGKFPAAWAWVLNAELLAQSAGQYVPEHLFTYLTPNDVDASQDAAIGTGCHGNMVSGAVHG